MNLPISWVVAGAIPATQAVKQAANIAATSASHFFGDLLQSNSQAKNPPQTASGHSVPIDSKLNPKASSESKSWSQRVDTLRTYLSRFVSDSRARYVQTQDVGKSEAVAISADGQGQPLLSGPEPIRTELEQFLQSRPDLTNEINELALRSSDSSPLHLLPNTEVATNGRKPWKLWIDA